MATATDVKPDVQDIGPISEFRFPRIEKGILVIRGPNGAGKSILLESVDTALRGKGSLIKKDGAAKGSLRFRGVTITVQKSTIRKGDLECAALDGDLNISSLINPDLKSPDAADAKRIKTLAALSGIEPDPSLFYELCGGQAEFERLIKPTETDDVVKLAGQVKRDLESAARQAEGQAEREAGKVQSLKDQSAGVNLDAEADERKLRDDLEVAIRNEARLKADAENAFRAKKAAQEASDALEDSEAEYKGPTIYQASRSLEVCKLATARNRDAVAAAKEALAKAEGQLMSAETEEDKAEEALESATRHEKTVAAWRTQIEAAKEVQSPDVDQLNAAADAVTLARAADHRGIKVREARAALAKADEAALEAKAHRTRAEQLREAARGTDDVLSSLVGKLNCQLRVKNGRLVLDTDRGEELYADLSDGERSLVAIRIAAGLLADKENGAIVLEQRIWQDLDLAARESVAREVTEAGELLMTAECDHSVKGQPLRAEVFQPNGAA